MSIATRVVVVALVVLAVVTVGAGVCVRVSARRSYEAAEEARLAGRIAWLLASLERDGAEIEMDPRPEPEGAAERWGVEAGGPSPLWGTGGVDRMESPDVRETSRTVFLGGSVADCVPGHVLEALGEVTPPLAYLIPSAYGDCRLRLRLWAATSTLPRQEAMARLSRAMLAVGPGVLAGSAILLALLVRLQLRPLTAMAAEARGIGPGSAGRRIARGGRSPECVALRESINGMIDRLAEGLARERRFAAAAAHELRTPVAQLRTQVEVALRRERPAAEYREALAECLADVERLQGIVQSLLTLARLEAGGRVRVVPVDLVEVLSCAARRTGVPLPANLAVVGALAVSGDRDLLEMALANVLDNAVRHAPGSPVEIGVREVDGLTRIVVTDRGPGIPEGLRERVFDPLFRGDAARTVGDGGDASGGLGLGLAIARSALRAMGGEIRCGPRDDGAPGAAFVVEVPAASVPRRSP